jgi:hypothetical protein
MASVPLDNPRFRKITRFLDSVLSGKQSLGTPSNTKIFIEAVYSQPDPTACVNKIISGKGGLAAIQSCLWFDISPTFLNGEASSLLKFFQEPSLKRICGGDFLQQILLHVVEPPIFWNAFVKALKDDKLDLEAQKVFAWLLLELLSLPQVKESEKYTDVGRDNMIQTRLLGSPEAEIRRLGEKIKQISNMATPGQLFDEDGELFGPGGRHDNDFPDFRKISILPTADELTSKEPPFLRRAAQVLEDPAVSDQDLFAMHLDNQFRLLREDMLGEMREELQIARGLKKGRHRGLVLKGFRAIGVDCGSEPKFTPWALKLQCLRDFPEMAKLEPKKRKEYWKKDINKKTLQHQSLACLLMDGEVVAFPAINRNEDLLAAVPPVLLLQFKGEASTTKALLRLKTAKDIKLVQIDTAVFSYEPILQRLQKMKHLELKDEMLLWKVGETLSDVDSSPTSIINTIESNPTQDLRHLLKAPDSIKLDTSQTSSLLMGLKQRVSLIQGPPG